MLPNGLLAITEMTFDAAPEFAAASRIALLNDFNGFGGTIDRSKGAVEIPNDCDIRHRLLFGLIAFGLVSHELASLSIAANA